MSCIVKYTSKSIHVKSLSRTKNKISPSKTLALSNEFWALLFSSSVMKYGLPFADVVGVWIFMMTLFKGTCPLSSPRVLWNCRDGPCGWRNLHVKSFFLFTTSINASHQNPSFKWLKGLILWCWYVQKGMGDEDGCFDTQLFTLDGVLRCWDKVVTPITRNSIT